MMIANNKNNVAGSGRAFPIFSITDNDLSVNDLLIFLGDSGSSLMINELGLENNALLLIDKTMQTE
jgi:hypothetical protein